MVNLVLPEDIVIIEVGEVVVTLYIVVEAVDAYTNFHNKELHLTTGKGKNNTNDDKVPSWWFIN